MKKSILYPIVPRKGQSFKGVKVTVVPNQSMTLQQIVKRFIKKESLPLSKEGFYEDRYDYDLEKIQKEDLVEKDEIMAQVKADVKAKDEKHKKAVAEEQDAMKRAAAAKKAELYEEFKKQQDPKNVPPKPPQE